MCTRVLWKNRLNVVVGRTMDWPVSAGGGSKDIAGG